jgi:hypothetical protein
MTWPKRFIVGILTAEVRSHSQTGQRGFVMDILAPGHISLQLLQFFTVSIIPLLLQPIQ